MIMVKGGVPSGWFYKNVTIFNCSTRKQSSNITIAVRMTPLFGPRPPHQLLNSKMTRNHFSEAPEFSQWRRQWCTHTHIVSIHGSSTVRMFPFILHEHRGLKKGRNWLSSFRSHEARKKWGWSRVTHRTAPSNRFRYQNTQTSRANRTVQSCSEHILMKLLDSLCRVLLFRVLFYVDHR